MWEKEIAQINEIVARWTEWTTPLVALRDEAKRLEDAYKAADAVHTPREWREIYSDDRGAKTDPRIVARESPRDAYFLADQAFNDARRDIQERAAEDVAVIRRIFRNYRAMDSEAPSSFDTTYSALCRPLGIYSGTFRGIGIYYEEK